MMFGGFYDMSILSALNLARQRSSWTMWLPDAGRNLDPFRTLSEIISRNDSDGVAIVLFTHLGEPAIAPLRVEWRIPKRPLRARAITFSRFDFAEGSDGWRRMETIEGEKTEPPIYWWTIHNAYPDIPHATMILVRFEDGQ